MKKLITTHSFQLAANVTGDESASKLALVIPGRLDTKDYAHIQHLVDHLAKRGFLAVSFDPPGTWESPGDLDVYTTTNYIKAVNELIEYFGHKPTFLAGHSRGGAVAILAGVDNPAVSCVAAIMANYGAPTPPDQESIKQGFKKSFRDLPPGTEKTTEQKEFNLPISYFKDGEQYDPVKALQGCSKPKLLIYGTQDEFTEPQVVKDIFASIPDPKMIAEVKATHDYRYSQEAMHDVNREVDIFLDQYQF